MTFTIENFSFRYSNNDFTLHCPDIRIKSSSLVTLIGPNGSGKTTFLKVIAKQIDHHVKFFWNKYFIYKFSTMEFAKYISYLPQTLNFNPFFTVLETLWLSRFTHNPSLKKTKKEQEIVEKYLEYFEIQNIRNKKIGELSGGQQKQVFLAATFVQETPIILLDEPLNNLDIPHQYHVVEILKKIVKEGKIIFFSTHNLEIAFEMADVTLFFKEGDIYALYNFCEKDFINLLSHCFNCKVEIDKGINTKKSIIILKKNQEILKNL